MKCKLIFIISLIIITAIYSQNDTYFFMPGIGNLYIYSQANNTIRIYQLQNQVYVEISGSPFNFNSEKVESVRINGGYYKVSGQNKFILFYSDNNGGGDSLTAGVSINGSERSDVLLLWAMEYVVVLSNDNNPGLVTLQIYNPLTQSFENVNQYTFTGPEQFHYFNVSSTGIYKITAQDGTITAIGSNIQNAQNNFNYIPSTNGYESGTIFYYSHPEILGGTKIVYISLEPSTTVTVTQNGNPIKQSNLQYAGTYDSTDINSNTLIKVEANKNILCWVESDPRNLNCDGTILDVDLVPGFSGKEIDNSFIFSTTVTFGTCYTDRRTDLDVVAYQANTYVQVWRKQGNSFVFETSLIFLSGGSWYRFGTNLDSGIVYKFVSDKPISIALSHQSFEFTGNAFSFYPITPTLTPTPTITPTPTLTPTPPPIPTLNFMGLIFFILLISLILTVKNNKL